MAITIKGLRAGLVVAAILLVAVIAGYLGYARFRLPHWGKDLAEKYGVEISNEGVSFSHTFGANTQFKLHAAREVEHKNGLIALHDVGIVMYGVKQDRSDRIHGNEFEYDSKAGVLKGVGEVFIDLAAPASDADRGPLKPVAKKTDAEDDSKIIHVKTSEVTFVEKEGSATTDAPVEFRAAGMTGTSVGASYNSKSGVIVLNSAVHMSGLRNGRPVVMAAARAEMDRDGNLVKLERSKVILETDAGARTVMADHSIVYMKDGNPQRINGQGHVELTGDGGGGSHGVADGDRMQMDLNPQGQPQTGFLAGNVTFRNEAPLRQEDGRGSEVHVAFDAQGRPVHSVMTGDVEMNVHEGTTQRKLNAAKLDLDLGGGGKDPVYVKGAVATGGDGARLRMVGKTGKDKEMNSTNQMRADVLVARFGDASSVPAAKVKSGMGPPLVGVDGKGRTYFEQVVTDAKGALQSKQTGTGDVLKADFHTDEDGKTELERAEQRGSVSLERESIAAVKTADAKATDTKAADAKATDTKNTGPQVEHAKADDVVYVAAAEETTLTGNVEVQDAESAVFADKVVSQRTRGVSTAEGGVKVSYLQEGSKDEPVHVLAARSVAHKDSGMTEFFAAPGGRAKMWQGGSQVEAPVLLLDRTKKTLVAKDVAGSDGAVVKTVIVDNSKADHKADDSKPDAAKKKQGSSGPMRVVSQQMIYTNATRVAEFKGKVRAEDADGVLHAQDALVYLSQPEDKTKAKEPAKEPGVAMNLGGRVDHMVSTGAVELDQPGRKATGDKLTYTANDQVFVLTGTKAAPPKIVDDLQGTTTGAALRFRTGDDSVVVLSGQDAGKVKSETHMKQGGKN